MRWDGMGWDEMGFVMLNVASCDVLQCGMTQCNLDDVTPSSLPSMTVTLFHFHLLCSHASILSIQHIEHNKVIFK
jgi:hypothetical protein